LKPHKLYFILLLFLFSIVLNAQVSPTKKEHIVSFKTQFIQIKDAFNYGLVYNGLNLKGSYSFVLSSDKFTFSYNPDLAFGAMFNKGVAMAWHVKPIDLFYGWKVNKSETKPLTIGPYFATNYNWQLYPYLQSGHMFWFSALEFGPRFLFTTPIKSKVFRITLTNSLAGWTSRPEPATETYFYSLTFSDFVNNAHSNMKFGSFDLFNHTTLEIALAHAKDKKMSIGYEFEYFGYFDDPRLSYMAHSINLIWKVGRN